MSHWRLGGIRVGGVSEPPPSMGNPGKEDSMKFGQLQGTEVVSLADASKLGSVDDVLLDRSKQQVLGLRIKRGGLFSGHEAVRLQDVKAIGYDAVTIEDGRKIDSENQFPEFQGSVHRDGIVGSRVMTENGTEVGTVADIDVDFQTGAITGYVLRAGDATRLQHTGQLVPVSIVKTIGDKMIVVADEVIPA